MIRPKSATSPSADGSFPRRCFVAISQAEAAGTNTSLAKDARTECALLESLRGLLLSPTAARVCRPGRASMAPGIEFVFGEWLREITRDGELALEEIPDRKSTRLNSSHLVISYAV